MTPRTAEHLLLTWLANDEITVQLERAFGSDVDEFELFMQALVFGDPETRDETGEELYALLLAHARREIRR